LTRGLSPFLPPRNSSWVCQAFKQLAAKTITVSPRPRGNTPLFHATLFTTSEDGVFLTLWLHITRGEAKATTVPRTFGISSRQIFIAGYYENFLFRLSGTLFAYLWNTRWNAKSVSFIIDQSKLYEQKGYLCYYALWSYLSFCLQLLLHFV